MTDYPAVFTDNGHVLISGITGSRDEMGGKTALANWWAATHGRANFDLVVFFNAKGAVRSAASAFTPSRSWPSEWRTE